MSMTKANFSGAFTALVSPFSPTGDAVDLERLNAQICFQASGGVQGVVACGTTGETPTLSADERRAIIAHSVEVGRPLGLSVIAGAGANAT